MAKPQNDFSAEAMSSAGLALGEIGRAIEGYRELAVDVVGFSVKGPQQRGDEVLIVVRGFDAEGAPVVAFHSAYTTIDAIRGLAARLNNGTLQWKADKFRGG